MLTLGLARQYAVGIHSNELSGAPLSRASFHLRYVNKRCDPLKLGSNRSRLKESGSVSQSYRREINDFARPHPSALANRWRRNRKLGTGLRSGFPLVSRGEMWKLPATDWLADRWRQTPNAGPTRERQRGRPFRLEASLSSLGHHEQSAPSRVKEVSIRGGRGDWRLLCLPLHSPSVHLVCAFGSSAAPVPAGAPRFRAWSRAESAFLLGRVGVVTAAAEAPASPRLDLTEAPAPVSPALSPVPWRPRTLCSPSCTRSGIVLCWDGIFLFKSKKIRSYFAKQSRVEE